MENKIASAIAAAHQQDWLHVTECLQQLPLKDNLLPENSISDEDLAKISTLALSVLTEGDFQQKWEIAKVLAKLEQIAIPSLIQLLENETFDLEIRWFAGRILSEFNDPRCIFALTTLLRTSEEEDLCLMAAQSLAKIGPSAIAALSSLLNDPDSRLLAVQSLAQIRCGETINPLIQVTGDPSPQIRATAIEALGSFHDERVLPILLAALDDRASLVRKEAIAALAMRSKAQRAFNLVTRLRPLLNDVSPEVCIQAASALGRMRTDEAAAVLFPLLKSPATPRELKLASIRALGWIETEAALTYLQQALQWSDLAIAQDIITVLGRVETPLRQTQASQILIEFISPQHPSAADPLIKQTVAVALGELGQAESQSILSQLANDPHQGVRLHAIAALKKREQRIIMSC